MQNIIVFLELKSVSLVRIVLRRFLIKQFATDAVKYSSSLSGVLVVDLKGSKTATKSFTFCTTADVMYSVGFR